MDKSSVIFGNEIDKKTLKKAAKKQKHYIKKYGNDLDVDRKLGLEPIEALNFLDTQNLVFSDKATELPKNALIVGNIRMGFGHYRISIAMASCAKALGYKPYWLDLKGFDCTGSKIIAEQNDMYSMASRISQKSKLFNHFVWEPLNCEGFKKLTYNAGDQKNCELLAPIYNHLPKDTPYIATHAWPAQAAIHGGMTHVVNAIPDNWPMALHLSEGAIHAVQTPYCYLGYKMLNGFDVKRELKGMPESDIKMVGHYVDHELVANCEADNAARVKRMQNGEPMRILLTVGGAGAGKDMFLAMLNHMLPMVERKEVALYINFGDHLDMYNYFSKKVKGFKEKCNTYFNQYKEFNKFVETMNDKVLDGITCIYNENIFEAVYATNLLMRTTDLLVTKPSELVYYPIPKVFMRHIGGHEVYGGIHGREIGDAVWECPDEKSINAMLDRLVADKDILIHMCGQIDKLKQEGYYNGAYECVKLAAGGKNDK